ncbi:SLATT domain-containing protein [Micromonospora saelicesensis]|uniref:SLATT domain-containing protein n=1 Tax=Micromonospora saelicesensis TaxID=285676 RepID=UPI0021ABAF44|nr:SLATT domain-containing protein [Micromonospora saelicesensis]
MEQLLSITKDIMHTENRLRNARLLNLVIALAVIFGPLVLLVLTIVTIATYGEFDMARINGSTFPVIAISGIICATAIHHRTEVQRHSVTDLRLQLSLLREQRRLRAADMTLDSRYARSAYKEEIVRDVEEFRRQSRYYRRVHNIFQTIIIVGSLATTTISGIALDSSPLQLAVVATSFLVGLSAGFTGYFKYRERGFYLQQTADAITQEWTAAELAIFRYKELPEEDQLALFVEEAERLKSEQRKREQSLDQPSGQSKEAGAVG